jgi:hypothetical protein
MTGLFCCVYMKLRLDIDDEMLYLDHVIRNQQIPNMQFTTYIRGSLIRFHILIEPSALDLRLNVVTIVPHIEDEALLRELCPVGWVGDVYNGYLQIFPL